MVLGVAAGLLAVCCVGGVVGAVTGGDKDDDAGATSLPTLVVTTAPATTPAGTLPTLAVTSAGAGTPSGSATETLAADVAPSSATATKPPTAKVPDLRGENAAVAQDTLSQLGFTNVRFGSADKEDTVVILPQNWTVKKQSAAPGKRLKLTSLIVLTCTKQG